MGRYESQRAIAARTISERRQASKGGRSRHGGWLAWFIGRTIALALTITAIGAVAWNAPRHWATPAAAPAVVTQPAIVKFGKAPFAMKLTSAEPEVEPARQRSHRHSGLRRHPASTAPAEPGYEVLGPDELAAISQAD